MPRKAWTQRQINLLSMGGAIGLVLLISTPLTWLLTNEWGLLVWGKLLLGSLLSLLYLATQRHVWAHLLGARSSGLWALSLLSGSAVLALVGMLNYAAWRHPRQLDVTREGLYTLSPQTLNVLAHLPEAIDVQAFYASYEPQFESARELLERYSLAAQGKLQSQFIDPQSRPDLVEKYQISERGPRLILSYHAPTAVTPQDVRVKLLEEQELTHALVKLTEQTPKIVYFLSGHGEADVHEATAAEGYAHVAAAITAEGYHVEVLNLAQTASPTPTGRVQTRAGNTAGAAAPPPLRIPDDAAVVVLAAPRRALLRPELAALETYLDRGGRLIALLEPHQDGGLETLLRIYKIALHDDMIVDTNPLNRLLGLGAAAPMIQPASVDHPIVKDVSAPLVMFTARSLSTLQGGNATIQVTSLAHSGDSAWGETNLAADGTASQDANDYLPPLDVVLASQKPIDKQPQALSTAARLVIFGDADWLSNRYLSMQGNQDFMLNSINWAADQTQKITIRPKARHSSQLLLSGQQLNALKFFSMDLLPVVLVACGLAITLVRRQA